MKEKGKKTICDIRERREKTQLTEMQIWNRVRRAHESRGDSHSRSRFAIAAGCKR